jgi:hypothetical protein
MRLVLLSAILWTASGCVGLDAWLKEKEGPVPSQAAAPPRPRPRVNPDDVTDTNAREVLEALREELDRSQVQDR